MSKFAIQVVGGKAYGIKMRLPLNFKKYKMYFLG